jgi:hypothetical protein
VQKLDSATALIRVIGKLNLPLLVHQRSARCVQRHTPRCDILFMSPLLRCRIPACSRLRLRVVGLWNSRINVHVNYNTGVQDQARSHR